MGSGSSRPQEQQQQQQEEEETRRQDRRQENNHPRPPSTADGTATTIMASSQAQSQLQPQPQLLAQPRSSSSQHPPPPPSSFPQPPSSSKAHRLHPVSNSDAVPPATATSVATSNAGGHIPPASRGAPSVSEAGEKQRRGSFSFLRRSKSREDTNARQSTRLSRRRKSLSKDQNSAADAPSQPPRLPTHQAISSTLDTPFSNSSSNHQGFNSHNTRNQNMASHPVPVPPLPEQQRGHTASPSYDPYARTESMTNRGRYSYSSSAAGNVNSPRRVRRRKDPTPFNILVVGTKNSGKSSFIEFLRTSLARPIRGAAQASSPEQTASKSESSFVSHYLETELEGERIGLTLYDSAGLERHIVDLQLREMSSFLESKFQETFNEEQKVMRATGVRDTHIHCVFLVLDPSRLTSNIVASGTQKPYGEEARYIGGLDERLDVDVIRALQGKTTIVPVISKADTVTTAHMTFLKKTVADSFKKFKFDPLEALAGDQEVESEDDSASSRDGQEAGTDDAAAQQSGPLKSEKNAFANGSGLARDDGEVPHLPMSIISPDFYDPGTVGRRFPWGFADPYNVNHCDFVKLKDSVFSEWRAELREISREQWYEGWRTSRLKKRGQSYVAEPSGAGRSTNGARGVSNPSQYSSNSLPRDINGSLPSRSARNAEIGVAISEE